MELSYAILAESNYIQVNRVLTKCTTQAYLSNCRVVSKTGETADSSVEIIDTVSNSCVKRQRGAVAENLMDYYVTSTALRE